MESEKYQGFIRGKTIELRPKNKDLIDEYLKWENDIRYRRLFRNDVPFLKEQYKKWLEEIENKTTVIFDIWHLKDNKLIGDVDLHQIHWRNRNALLGLIIGDLDYWGKGLCTEALKLMINYGFEELNLHKIIAFVNGLNIASQKCLVKAGMKFEATMKEEAFLDGQYVDNHIYCIFDTDWFAFHSVKEI